MYCTHAQANESVSMAAPQEQLSVDAEQSVLTAWSTGELVFVPMLSHQCRVLVKSHFQSGSCSSNLWAAVFCFHQTNTLF